MELYHAPLAITETELNIYQLNFIFEKHIRYDTVIGSIKEIQNESNYHT